MADVFTFQTLKTDADGFSFGHRYSIDFLLLLIAVVAFGAIASIIPSWIKYVFAAFAFIAAISLSKYIRNTFRNEWNPAWGVNRQGLIIQSRSDNEIVTVPWKHVRFIKLMKYFTPECRYLGGNNTYRNAVLIGIQDDFPASWLEKFVHRYQPPDGLPPNVILKSYSGATQEQVADLVLGFAPLSIPFEKIEEPFTTGFRFNV